MRFFFLLLCSTYTVCAQNIQSLLLERDIQSTFAIIGLDPETEELGIAVATNNIYVGNSTIYIKPGVGAIATIAETQPEYGIIGLKKLEEGEPIDQILDELKAKDEDARFRQIGGLDANGIGYAFTGESVKYWSGVSGQLIGQHYVVLGNQLAPKVLEEMAKTFEDHQGALPDRLLESLLAGQRCGGQISGKQSAALVVKGPRNQWYNQIDLRVDHSKSPFQDLKQLWNFHQGRILVNQSLYASRGGNLERGKSKISEAAKKIEGWTGMYSKAALAFYLAGEEKQAVRWIQKALLEDPYGEQILPFFYALRNHEELESIIRPDQFTAKDWEFALNGMLQMGKSLTVIELIPQLFKERSSLQSSASLHFLLGKAYFINKEINKSLEVLNKTLAIDNQYIEARLLKLEIQQLEE